MMTSAHDAPAPHRGAVACVVGLKLVVESPDVFGPGLLCFCLKWKTNANLVEGRLQLEVQQRVCELIGR